MATIRNLESKYLHIPLGKGRGGSGATGVDFILVEMTSSDGLIGTGFTFALTGGGTSVKTYLDDTAAPVVLNTKLQEWDKHWHTLWDKHQRMGNGNGLLALSAIDIAVWDIRAKEQNLPLYHLLGAQRETMPIYGSGRATHGMTTTELIEGALSYKEEGYRAIKLRAGALGIAKDVKRIQAVREAVGDDFDIMVDCNERLTYPEALQLGRHLEELNIYWMEEPLPAGDINGHQRLAEQLRIPIAVGEHLHGRFEFVNYIKQNAASIFQPDVPLVGGISEWNRIANITEGHGYVLTPHFLPEFHIQLGLSAKNCISIEHFPLIDDILLETLQIENGVAIPPNRSGHGLQWDREKIDYYQKLL
ncbi:mandelate racemase/muconate lactonizing enzyme family protein [Indiicoccus explosivorum]|uniref:mandelate racemase/muconate lactonizing enzyme family protein n=1 Tax=Indiicoccus explosivorum TaxID=1917864 RepID=UPI00139001EA|nr:mandelate racemase/muconate lactonizing enzyme family protein [Indiicoccus explosivorum]